MCSGVAHDVVHRGRSEASGSAKRKKNVALNRTHGRSQTALHGPKPRYATALHHTRGELSSFPHDRWSATTTENYPDSFVADTENTDPSPLYPVGAERGNAQIIAHQGERWSLSTLRRLTTMVLQVCCAYPQHRCLRALCGRYESSGYNVSVVAMCVCSKLRSGHRCV